MVISRPFLERIRSSWLRTTGFGPVGGRRFPARSKSYKFVDFPCIFDISVKPLVVLPPCPLVHKSFAEFDFRVPRLACLLRHVSCFSLV